MKAAITDFLLICIMWKTVKWIELLKDWLYQHQIWDTFGIRLWGMKRQISIINESDWSKNMAAQPMYFRNERGLEMIGHNSHSLCPFITNLGGRDVPIRSEGSGPIWAFFRWLESTILNVDPSPIFFFFQQFVAEHRRARSITLADLWIKCLQCGKLKLESERSPTATCNICYTDVLWSCI